MKTQAFKGKERSQQRDRSGNKDNIVYYVNFPRPGPPFAFSQASGSSHLILAKYHQPFLHASPYLESGIKGSADCMMPLQAFARQARTVCAEQTRKSWGLLSSLCSPLGAEIEGLQLSVCLHCLLDATFPVF